MGRPVKDISGQHFGKLTVIRESERRGKAGEVYWFCACDCGNEAEVIGNNLRSGQSKSCGCERTLRSGFNGEYHGNAFKDLTGNYYGRWHVLGYIGKVKGSAVWLCECSCGTIREVVGNNLRRGQSISCGCYQRERSSLASFRHGLTEHPLYCVWSSMKDRCNNPHNKAWRWYGGKGIKVSQEWDDFTVFLSDMQPTWQAGLSLDRRDSSKGYSKENCRWVTARSQWEEAYRNRYGRDYEEPKELDESDLWSDKVIN